MDRLSILKALGDNTRYAIYLEVVRAPSPRSTGEVAESLGLHPNTVRPHLERMRDVGLLDVEVDSKGLVGRPTHRYSVAAGAPSLGLEPPAFPVLARMLVSAAGSLGVGGDDVVEAGREQGRALAAGAVAPPADGDDDELAEVCVGALAAALESLGFDPASETDDVGTTIAFTHCPFRELAEAHPEVVCHLHRGIVEGFVEGTPSLDVASFGTLVDREPCQVVLSRR